MNPVSVLFDMQVNPQAGSLGGDKTLFSFGLSYVPSTNSQCPIGELGWDKTLELIEYFYKISVEVHLARKGLILVYLSRFLSCKAGME